MFLFFLAILPLASVRGQVTCDRFCVMDITMDTVPGQLMISVALDGDGSTFINYPYPELLIDDNGDTVATGSMFFFGQFGGTTNQYPCSTSLSLIPPGFTGTVVFNYDSLSCRLPYPCTAQTVGSADSRGRLSVFPNPSTASVLVKGLPANRAVTILLTNLLGVPVRTWIPEEKESAVLDLIGISPGCYILRSSDTGPVRLLIE